MRLLVSEIRAAGRMERIEELPSSLLGSPPKFVAFHHPLKAVVQATFTEPDILVSGKISTTLVLTCARCLEDFERQLEADFYQLFNSTLDVLDMTNEIRDSVLLDLPVRAICKEDCQGICPGCGENKNISSCACDMGAADSRWNALKGIQFKR